MVKVKYLDKTTQWFQAGHNYSWPKGQLVVYGAWGEILLVKEMKWVESVEGTYQPSITVHHAGPNEYWVTEDFAEALLLRNLPGGLDKPENGDIL